MLDWVAQGLYGMLRPSLPSGFSRTIGPFNTYEFNEFPFDASEVTDPGPAYLTTDDIFKRILTWHLYKGDGKVFNIRWLKRRIMRFLYGVNGTAPNIDQTYPISVEFGADNSVTITIQQGSQSIPDAGILQSAIDSGVLELPFQYTFTTLVT